MSPETRNVLECHLMRCVLRCVGSRCRLIHGAHLIGFTGRSAASRLVVASRHVQRRQKNVREFWSVNWLDVPSLNSPKASPTKMWWEAFPLCSKKGRSLYATESPGNSIVLTFKTSMKDIYLTALNIIFIFSQYLDLWAFSRKIPSFP